jgi:precorrin-2 dehydrogenase / sirohydrochlorin ferrochelatase
LLIDLDLQDKRAVILGGGREAELKAQKLADSGALTSVVAIHFTKGLKSLARGGRVKLIEMNPRDVAPFIENERPVVVFISTGRPGLDEELAKLGRSIGSLVCVVDTPVLNDFNMPAIAKLGSVRVAISTGGKSPAMAKVLRRRIEKTIRLEDVLQVELQDFIRGRIGRTLKSASARKRMVYAIIQDDQVSRLLREENLEGAKVRAGRIIRARVKGRD